VAAMQDFTIRKVREDDREAVVNIFNYFVENSYAAYPDTKADSTLFDFLNSMAREGIFYVIQNPGDGIVGFGLLRHHQRSNTFDRAAELTYFILPDYSRHGLGTRLLQVLEKEAGKLGVQSLLANISSLNQQSLSFHNKQGFRQCGLFERIGSKYGKEFDVVWMQKFINTQ
jgi:L-amino acid N-acyltransferase YncA